MAEVIFTLDEYKYFERLERKSKALKTAVQKTNIFEDNNDCWNTEKDIVRPFTLEETKRIYSAIMDLLS